MDLATNDVLAETWVDNVASDLLVLGGADGQTHTGTWQTGLIGVGAAPLTNTGLWIANNGSNLAGPSQYGIFAQPSGSATGTTEVTAVQAQIINGAGITTGFATGVHVLAGNHGTGSTITTMYGVLVESQTQGGTNNYGVVIGAPSGGSGQNIGLLVGGGSPGISVLSGGIQVAGAPVLSTASVRIGTVNVSATNGSDTTLTVTFATAMPSAPTPPNGCVMLTHRLTGSDPSRVEWGIDSAGITTTGFGLQVRNDTGGTVNVTIDYLAVLAI